MTCRCSTKSLTCSNKEAKKAVKKSRKTFGLKVAVVLAAVMVFGTAAAAAENGSWGSSGGWPGYYNQPGGYYQPGGYSQPGDFSQPGNYNQPGGYSNPFGNNMQPNGFGQQSPFSADKTELKVFPSVRAVKTGEELKLDFDLILSQDDMGRVSVIQEGTELEYTLAYTPIDDENTKTETAAEKVRFTMNREENEKCTLTLYPQVDRTSVLVVQSKMIFSDGETQECTSDKILVYTEPEIRSHLSKQGCESGEVLQADFMMIGPEGRWQFTCYPAVSLDNGNTYTRSEEPVGSFTVNTHEQEPQMKIQVTVTADQNCMYRLETVVVLPDGQTMEHFSDPVRVSTGNNI